MKYLQPAHWPRPKGYANGVVASGRTVFVSGMIGSDAQGKVVTGGFVIQACQTLKNIVEVLSEAGAKPEHIVRMNWYVVDKNEYLGAYKKLGAVYRDPKASPPDSRRCLVQRSVVAHVPAPATFRAARAPMPIRSASVPLPRFSIQAARAKRGRHRRQR